MAGALAQRRIKDVSVERVEDLPDGSLLERYLTGDEAAAQRAFKALVERMVRWFWGSAATS